MIVPLISTIMNPKNKALRLCRPLNFSATGLDASCHHGGASIFGWIKGGLGEIGEQ